jgi:hypothetical protein
MRPTLAGILVLAVIDGHPPAVLAGDAAVTVQGFCIAKTGTRCEEVALPGSTVAYDRLPKRADGARVVYFYSDQRAESKTILLHALEAEDMDAGVRLAVPKALASQATALGPALEAAARTFGKGGLVEVTPFETVAGGAPSRAFSVIAVEGPGVFSGQVLDRTGAPVAGSARVSFTVTRRPAESDHPTVPGSGLKSYDADG